MDRNKLNKLLSKNPDLKKDYNLMLQDIANDEEQRKSNIKKYPILRKKYLKGKKEVYGINLHSEHFIYKDVLVFPNTSLFIGNKQKKEDGQILIDLLSFLEHSPLFIETSDIYLNTRMLDLYKISSDADEHGKNIAYTKNYYKRDGFVVKVDIINHINMFSLYHTALKQPEPLAKCIFLFRIVEYAFKNIKKENNFKWKKKNKKKIKDYSGYLEHLLELSLKHRFIPIYGLDGFSYDRKNQILLWKKNVRGYIKNWSIYGVGKKLYKFGRCGVAHGGNIKDTILQDYNIQYKELIKINKTLELIVRYLIENENQHIRKIVRFN